MGCVLALCLPFDVKKSSWVTPLFEASVAPRGHQGPLGRRPWCQRRRRSLDEVPGAFPGLQDVQDAHGGVRGVGDVLGRFSR